MPTPIDLFPSSGKEVLVNTIIRANLENRMIRLMPGSHFTKPNRLLKILINANGLHIKGNLRANELSTIKRPDNAIDVKGDYNYGLFFIPSKATDKELARIKNTDWIKFKPDPSDPEKPEPYHYVVIVRGEIIIENLELDCNMGNQQLPVHLPDNIKIEHSAMLGFAGRNRYKHPSKDPFFKDKFIYVSFKSVTIKNIIVRNGGYADDIWISRGYQRPNIEQVVIRNITSDLDNPINPRPRINPKRSTISFSGLTENVEITRARITSLQAEATTTKHWTDLPGKALTDFTKFSRWKLQNVVCDVLDLATKGKAIFLNADNVRTRKLTLFFQTGGLIKNCNFIVPAQAVRLTRLNELLFSNVTWIFEADKNEKVSGMSIVTKNGDSCIATFDQNTFKVATPFVSGQFIFTEYSKNEPDNTVSLAFINCKYDERIKKSKLVVARVMERGKWKFTTNDFRGVPTNKVLNIKPDAETDLNPAGILEITIA